MSVASRTRMKRYAVTFETQRIFMNAGDEAGALALARTRFMKVYREAGVDMPAELGSIDTFRAAAYVAESERY